MTYRHTANHRRWVLVVTIVAALSGGWLLLQRARSGELERLDTAVNLIPEDAAFYSSMLRNREQIEAIANSQAWARLKEMPFVKMGVAVYQLQAFDPNSPVGQFQAALQDPQIRELVDVLGEMVSDEIFFYGDDSSVGFIELIQQISSSMRYGPVIAEWAGQTDGIDKENLQGTMLLAALSENLDLLKVPNLVVGFKLQHPDRAIAQLDRLEQLATPAFEADPTMQGRFQSAEIAGHEYLTLSLDGEMVPWHELPLDEIRSSEREEGDLDKVVARIKKSTLVIALGVRDDYLLLSIGSSTDCLAKLGGAPKQGKRLIDGAELKPLDQFADRRVAEISYVSQAMMGCIVTSKQDVDEMLEVVDAVLPQTDLAQQEQAQIRKDAAALAEDLKKLIPEPGAISAISFLTDQGIENYQYNWGDHSQWDGSKPLGLLEHVGGNPLLAVVARGKHSPEQYDLLVKWLKVAYGYFDQYALPEMSPGEREKFQRFVELACPLLERLDKANREMLIPALADGQAGLVIDAKLTSRQFLQEAPQTDEPMPMVEPAIVIGVSDAELLRKACGEYRAVAEELLQAVRTIEPGAIPEGYSIPDPEVTQTSTGTIYTYALPQQWGVDSQIAPNFGLSDSVAVLSISRDHTQRLLESKTLSAAGALAETGRPLAMAVVFDWAAVVDVVTPWINLAVDAIIEAQSEGGFVQADAVKSQVATVLEVLKVLRTITSKSYLEDNVMVTHTLIEIRDVEP